MYLDGSLYTGFSWGKVDGVWRVMAVQAQSSEADHSHDALGEGDEHRRIQLQGGVKCSINV